MITLAISAIFLISVTRYLIKLPASSGRSIFQSSSDNRFFRLRLLEPSLNARYPLTSLCNRSRFFPLNVEYDCLARLFLVLPATHGSRQFYNVSFAANADRLLQRDASERERNRTIQSYPHKRMNREERIP